MINGTSGDDTLDGTSGDDTINGLGGNDTLNGLGGSDSLDGGDDDDVLNGGAGNDTHTGGAGCDDFRFDPIAASGDIDVITDFALGDSITIGDTVFSEKDPGADLITFIGTAAFSSTAGEVRYTASGGATLIEVDIDGDGAADQSINITNGEFTLRTTMGNGPVLEIDGAFGAATSGEDKLIGTTGFDSLDGGDGNDVLRGMGGTDFVIGGEGDDTIHEGLGNDFIDGGIGTDLLSRHYAAQINLTVSELTIADAISNEADALQSIEKIFISNRLAPASDDTIDGSAALIELDLNGGAGDDIIIGGEAVDNIEGDSGDDTLTGGVGADTFDFDYIDEVGTTGDVVTDLELSDRIDFSLINTLGEMLDPDGLDLIFIGEAAFSSTAGEFRFSRAGGETQIQFDVDGDGTADRFVTITAGEFILAETAADSAVLQISASASATAGADSLVGSNGDDTIDGLAGNDTIQGLLGNDSLIGGADDDLIQASGGNDTLSGGNGADTLEGGDGNDTADYSTSASAVLIDLNTSTFSMGDAQGDVLSSIERVVGSAFDDTLIGLAGNETLLGGDGADDISGLGGNDGIDGGDGADLIEGGAGADTLIGGIGDDTLTYVNSTAVTVNLGNGTGSGGDAQGDSFSGFENVIGSAGNDSLTGNASANNLMGTGGDDTLDGEGDNDTLEGGDGSDSLDGGTGSDSLLGGDDNDTLRGVGSFGNENNTLDGGAGIDRVILKTETDAASFTHFFSTVDDPTAGFGYITTVSGVAAAQTLIDIEVVEVRDLGGVLSRLYEISLGATTDDLLASTLGLDFNAHGGSGADTLTGGTGNDSLDGGVGVDSLSGGTGIDTLIGGAGADILTGGSGADSFIVDMITDLSVSTETVTDFEIGDFLFLTGLSAAERHYIGLDAFTGSAGEYRIQVGSGQTLIEFDTDGDGSVDRTINITNGEFLLRETFEGSDVLEIAVVATATSGADSIVGTIGDDTIDGLAGNDTILGSRGNDSLIGGEGIDSLFGDSGDDVVSGGAGNDLVEGEEGNDTVTGGTGNDVFEFDTVDELGTAGDIITDLEVGDTINFFRINQFGELGLAGGLELIFLGETAFSGTAGEYRYEFNAGTTQIQFDTDGDGSGDRFVTITNGEFSLVETSTDSAILEIGPSGMTILGTSGNDSLDGTSGDDEIDGLAGNDTLRGLNGADTLSGSAGKDLIFGNNGDDFIRGGTENDDLRGSVGNDTLFGDNGRDYLRGNGNDDDLRGGAGGDTLDGGLDNDQLRGASGDDTLNGRFGDDLLSAGIDDDLLRAHEGNDTLVGGDGEDTLFGNPGNDTLSGGNGNDDLRGGNDDDTLSGDDGNDTLRGNSGDDQFNFELGDDDDRFIGFIAGAGSEDVIALSGFGPAFDTFAEVLAVTTDDGSGNAVIDFGGGDTITISGVSRSDLHEDDFIFV